MAERTDVNTFADHVATRDDFVKCVRLLEQDRINNKSSWEAQSIEGYLEALGAWVEDLNGGEFDPEKDTMAPSWRLFAQILIAAKYYE